MIGLFSAPLPNFSTAEMCAPENKDIKVAKKIFVQTEEKTPTDFLDKVQKALQEISSGEVGQRLLKKIGEGKHRVLIKYVPSECTTSANKELKHKIGIGCSSIIKINESETSLLGFKAEKIDSPFFISLAHELIHAYHNSYGKNKDLITNCNQDIWTNREEYKTIIGYPSKNPRRTNPKINENAIRAEHNLPLRYSHVGYDKVTHKKSKEIQEEARHYKVTAIFQQTVLGASPHQGSYPIKIHRVSLAAFKNLGKNNH